MSYYSKNSEEYIKKTINVDLKDQYSMFLKYLNKGDSILDVGFGSGRDMLYFRDLGFNVSGVDNEQQFVLNAQNKGLNAVLGDSLTYTCENKYDGIWCCASLVHFSLENIKKAIDNLMKSLKDDGVMYISFKYGDFVGYQGERFFTYINEERLKELNLNIIEKSISVGKLSNDLKWLNLVIKK